MRLLLVRHGTAEEKLGKRDAERALTREGREEVGLTAGFLAASVDGPMRLLSSPYLRAEQTAEILRERLATKEKIAPTDALLPESDWGTLRTALEPLMDEGVATVVAVGHNPSITEILATLIGGESGTRVAMVKGAAACVEIEHLHGRPAGELKWFVTPRALRGHKKHD